MKYKNPTKGVVNLHLVGVGGTGSILAHHIVRLDLAMKALGHPGFNINLWDPDVVEAHNIGRQMFTLAEVGANKAEALALKLRNHYCINIQPHASGYTRVDTNQWTRHPDLLIGCVDTRKARRELYGTGVWAFDCGNTANTGQVLMQHPSCPDTFAEFPGLTKGQEDATPTCSLAESLGRQELYINSMVATTCSQMLWQAFRHGGLDYRGAFINLKNNIEIKTLS